MDQSRTEEHIVHRRRISILEHRTRRYPSEMRRSLAESADPRRGDQHDNVGLIVSCVSVIIDLHEPLQQETSNANKSG